ncbi:hypothetical protein H4R19_004043 [Coemansia spiralis]|nr:hypothetical protein H4R19_004043 [Coemansia spiralis]
MAAESLDGLVQPRLSMIALGLLAGLAGLWVYSATRDGEAHPRNQRGAAAGGRTSLHRTQSIRRPRRRVSTGAVAVELRGDTIEVDAAAAVQAAAATVTAAARLAQEASAPDAAEAAQPPPDEAYDSESADDVSDGEADSAEADMRLMHLLCLISEDQARRNGTIHRGTSCNSCHETPIRGVRYKCAQCANYDLCESCEAHEIHQQHLMLRVAVPIPPLMNPREPLIQGSFVNAQTTRELSTEQCLELEQTTCLDRVDILSLFSEFSVLAAETAGGKLAISKDTFYSCLGQFGGTGSVIASRLFAYYDADGDGELTFEEMARGFSTYNKGAIDEKAPCVFRAYDVDGDGRVSRDDLRIMLEAFVDTNREITNNMVRTLEDDVLEQPSKLLPGQPISAAFTAAIPTDSPSGLDKEVSALRAEVLALRESSAARRVALLPVGTGDPSEAGRAPSDEGSSAPSVAATTSATVGTIVSSRMPQRLQTSSSLPDSRSDAAIHASAAAAAASFTDTIHEGPGRLADDVTGGGAVGARGTQQQQPPPPPPLVPPTLWHDPTEDSDWPVMEALSQDAIRLMIEEIFAEAAPKDPISMTYDEFVEYIHRNPSMSSYLEVLGTIF